MPTLQSPQQAYTPRIREPLPLPRAPIILPAPPEAPDEPPKIDWLQTLLPPIIMIVVLSIVASLMQSSGFIIYTLTMVMVYPLGRGIAYVVQKNRYEKEEEERKQEYKDMLAKAEGKIIDKVRQQRSVLNTEYLTPDKLISLVLAKNQNGRLWYRSKAASDFLALRVGIATGRPSFAVEVSEGSSVDKRDPLLEEAHKLKKKYELIQKMPYLLDLRKLGSTAILGHPKTRYQLTHRLLLDALVHHRPDELEIIVLSTHRNASSIWGWLRWAPHCRSFVLDKEYKNLVFGPEALKTFLGQFEKYIHGGENKGQVHKLIIVDVNGVQQYDDEFIQQLIQNAAAWNLSSLFVGGEALPHLVQGLLKFNPQGKCVFVDTREEQGESTYENRITLDPFLDVQNYEQVSRTLAGMRLLGKSGEAVLPGKVSLFDVLQQHNEEKITFKTIIQNWTKEFDNEDLLKFPIGLVENEGELDDYSLNLLEARFGGKDAYHTMLIGTTGSGKSEFIKSLILGGIYKYPPQYLNFFCMDFKGGSTIDQLEGLPHVVGVMTNLDETLAQRGLIAIRYEIDRRQAELKAAEAKDIWEYNEDLSLENRMPHLVLVLDEFTRGLDMLDDPAFSLQDLLEKRLVPQGRSLGVYLILANQVANAKVQRLLPNVGWKIALKVASDEQMRFIDKSLKSPKLVGRGYIKSMGEKPTRFQSGYSGYYVKYLQIKHRQIDLSRFLPDGSAQSIEVDQDTSDTEQDNELYLEMNQLIGAAEAALDRLKTPQVEDIYLQPLPRKIEIEQIMTESTTYRLFKGNDWTNPIDEGNLLSVPIGFVDLVYECNQHPVTLDFQRNNPALWIVGSQSDVIAGLRTILFSLACTHTPEEVQFYMLEFGAGLRLMPKYPHVGDLLAGDQTERIERIIQLFEGDFQDRETASLENGGSLDCMPAKFLVVNNVAGLKVASVEWFERIMILIQKEAYKYGIYIILASLPRSAGGRVSASDLKIITSRIVFPSINPENYWQYLDVGEKKLPALTRMDEQSEGLISRAHWLATNDSRYQIPLEMQICEPIVSGSTDVDLAARMKEAGEYATPPKIDILEDKYLLDELSLEDRCVNEIPIGIGFKDLKPVYIKFEDLPSVWGIGGGKESGKTNFLAVFVHFLSLQKDMKDALQVLSMYPSKLTSYCEQQEIRVSDTLEKARKHLMELQEITTKNDQRRLIIIIEDIHLLWERDEKELIEVLDYLAYATYDNPNIMFVVSFSYPGFIQSQRLRNVMIKLIHDHRTGLCLSYEDEWALDRGVLLGYRKSLNSPQLPPGRGFWVQKGKEQEMQTLYYSGE